MTLLSRVKELCEANNETLASLEKKLGFGNATIRKWDDATPSGDRLTKVADYFNVSVDYLLGRTDNPKNKSASEQIDDGDIKFALFGGDKEITDEMLEEVKRFAEFVKQKKKEDK